MLDRSAFTAIFEAHFGRVVRFVQRRIDDTGAAEEIAADAFELAWHRLDPSDEALPWLYKTAAFKIGDYYKKTRRKRSAELALQRLIEEPPDHLDPDDATVLRQALAGLPGREKEAIVLTYWDGLSAADAAAVLNCSTATIWTTLSRARTHLRHSLAQSGMSSMGRKHS